MKIEITFFYINGFAISLALLKQRLRATRKWSIDSKKKTWKDEEEKMKFHILQQRNEEINAKKE